MKINVDLWDNDTPYGVSLYIDGELSFKNDNIYWPDVAEMITDSEQTMFRDSIRFLITFQYMNMCMKYGKQMDSTILLDRINHSKYESHEGKYFNEYKRKPNTSIWNIMEYLKSVNDLGEKV